MDEEALEEEMDEPKRYDFNQKMPDWGWRRSNSWVWGILLIITGAILLLELFDESIRIINTSNWWAIFIMAPGFNMIVRGWHTFRRTGRYWGSLLWGLLLVGFSLSQLVLSDWGAYVWPVMLVIGGLALLVGGKRK